MSSRPSSVDRRRSTARLSSLALAITNVHQTRVPTRETTSMSSAQDDVMLSTTAAGLLIGRSGTAVREACVRGTLPGSKDSDGFWRVQVSDVLAWSASSTRGRGNPLPTPRTEEVVRLLADWGSASADEIATVLRLHVGNARKYLAMLAAEGRAERRSDGQWVLTTTEVCLAS